MVFEVAGTKAAGVPPAGAARGPRRPGRKKKNYVSLASLSPASSPFAAGRDHRRCFMPGRGTGGVSKYLRPYFNDYDRGGHVRRGHSRGRSGSQSWRHLAFKPPPYTGRRSACWMLGLKQQRLWRRRPCPSPTTFLSGAELPGDSRLEEASVLRVCGAAAAYRAARGVTGPRRGGQEPPAAAPWGLSSPGLPGAAETLATSTPTTVRREHTHTRNTSRLHTPPRAPPRLAHVLPRRW